MDKIVCKLFVKASNFRAAPQSLSKHTVWETLI